MVTTLLYLSSLSHKDRMEYTYWTAWCAAKLQSQNDENTNTSSENDDSSEDDEPISDSEEYNPSIDEDASSVIDREDQKESQAPLETSMPYFFCQTGILSGDPVTIPFNSQCSVN